MAIQVANSVLVNNVTMRDIERLVERVVKTAMNELEERLVEKLEKQTAKPPIIEREKSKTVFIKRIEAAKLLRVNVSTIDDWTKAGFLRSHRIGGRVYYTQADLDEAMGLNIGRKNIYK